MRVLFVAFPWRTHIHREVSMAWALHTAGHEVHFASTPEMADVITEAGLTAAPVGPDVPVMELFERAKKEIGVTPEEMGRQAASHIALAENREEALTWENLKWICRVNGLTLKIVNDEMVDDLVAYCRWWEPDLVIWEAMGYAGSIAATAVGAAHARMPIGLDVDAQRRRNFLRVQAQQPPQEREDVLAQWLGVRAEQFGAEFSEEMVTGHFTIDQMLGSMGLETGLHRLPVGHAPYCGRAVVPDWVRAEPKKPRVLATFGVSSRELPELQALSSGQLQEMLDSLADLDIELVLTLPASVQEELQRVPDNVRLVEFVPLHVIIGSCSAVIHHGGIPAFLESVARGIPQLMVTSVAPDVSLRGAKLRDARAGTWLPPEDMSGATIRENLVRLLDPSFREGAGRLRQELLSQPVLNDVVPELEKLAARYGSRRPR